MSDDQSVPLLGESSRSGDEQDPQILHDAEENTPLLSRSSQTPRYDGEEDEIASPAAASLRSLQDGEVDTKAKGKARWPTLVAVTLLGTLVIGIILSAFFAPAAVEEYAKESLVIEPTKLSIDSFTASGVRARIQADFKLDASRVKNEAVRNIGRAGTWIARKVESKESKLEVFLPEYGNMLLGTALIPGIVVSIRNGETTHLDFLTDLEPGDVGGLRRIANDWLEGRLGELRVLGKANVEIKSGVLSLGTQTVSESLVFEGHDLPALPQYNITRLNFREVQLPADRRGMAADVTLSVLNPYPVKFSIPPLGFDILVPNCALDQPYLQLADATTDEISIEPYTDVIVDVGGVVRELDQLLTKTCPNSHSSPLDLLLGGYIHGEETKVFVRGSNSPSPETPQWISDIISSVTVPVPFPGRTFDNLVRNFSLADVHFGLPDPFAEPGTPESNPRVSGNIVVLANLPKEMNFGVNVSQVRATADIYYKRKKFGELNLKKWQHAKSNKVETEDGEPAIKIESKIDNAPINITDSDVFTDVVQELLFSSKGVDLTAKALVDVEVGTVLGSLVIKDVPGEGVVPIKAITKRGGFDELKPRVSDIKIINTTSTSLTFQALVNFTNPTNYTASIPYVSIHILNNGSVIALAIAENLSVTAGNNSNVSVSAMWDPHSLGGKKAAKIGRDLISQYVSGWNTTISFRTHSGTIPSLPDLGQAMSKFSIEVPTPRLSNPDEGDDDDDGDDDGQSGKPPKFIKDATFHLWSSTATFNLISPLQQNDLVIEAINATAIYNHTEPIGNITHDIPFSVPPGLSTTPRLPVDWSPDSVGYDKLKNALGGGLKLDAVAVVDVRLENFREQVWYKGGGIRGHVRF